jgi:tetratricopeptide (TPR) repeat protein
MTASDHARGKRTIRVFIASPGDLAGERRAFKEQVDLLNEGFGDGAGVEFVGLGWEDTLATTGRRVQAVINREIDSCDAFILAMYRRWGQPAPDSSFSSYTEEEFHRALQRFTATKAPEIFVFFKEVDQASVGDPGPELTKVLKFRVELEGGKTIRFRTFKDTAEFGREVDRHLRAFAKGELPTTAPELDRLPLPLHLVERVEQAQEEARKRAEEAEARSRALQDAAESAQQKAQAQEARAQALESLLAIQSAQAASEGSLEQARQTFANATLVSNNAQVLHLAFEFYWRAGPLSAAEDVLQRWLAVNGWDTGTEETATALRNLGDIHFMRQELARAEELYRDALVIAERRDRDAVAAAQYDRLGLIEQVRGDFNRAKVFHQDALAIYERIHRPDGMSEQCTNLALVHHANRNAAGAEAMHLKALRLSTSASDARSLPIVTIPTVVHVVLENPKDVSDAQVNSQIAALNLDYRASNSEIASVPYPFKSRIGDARIQFQLARTDPNGKSTAGITRNKTRRREFGNDDAVKSREHGAEAWDYTKYLNIWVCRLGGGLLSASNFPGDSAATDGVVIHVAAFGTLGTASAPFNKGRTATHSIAKYLGVRQIWDSAAQTLDTPSQKQPNFGAPTFPHISANNGPYGDMFMNFLDYVDDEAMSMFTKGQVLQMQETLRTSRKGLGLRAEGGSVTRKKGRGRRTSSEARSST